jgi:hypothetical protein
MSHFAHGHGGLPTGFSGQASAVHEPDEVADDGPSPEDPNRFVEGGNVALDGGPDAAPGDANDEEDPKTSLPPGAATKDDPPAA